jgi:hypothetical protein
MLYPMRSRSASRCFSSTHKRRSTPGSFTGPRQFRLLGQIFDLIDSSFEVTVDRKSISAAICDGFSDALLCANRIAYLLRIGLGTSTTLDETAFVALYIAPRWLPEPAG